MSEASSPPLPWLPPRRAESHKGHFGQALLVGGSRQMTGAISLAGMAALRGGAGRVTLAVPETCVEAVAGHEPSYMTVPLPCDGQGRLTLAAKDRIAEVAAGMTCLGCGPGLGRTPQLAHLVSWMYESIPQPIVIDADGLFALAERMKDLGPPAGPRVLTPHPGEFRRLARGAEMEGDQYEELAAQMAQRHGIVIVLKTHRTLITDGRRSAYNTTGNPGMASGGTGDVLTGLIVALVCQGLPRFEAAQLACYVHGLAGDLAAEQLGQVAMIASDMITFLPPAFRRLEELRTHENP